MFCGDLMKKFITKKDIIIVLIVLLIGVGGIIILNSRQVGKTATVRVDGELVETVSLDSDFKKNINGVIVAVEDGEIFVKDSNCPDKVCQRSGKISKSGESIICAPNRVSIEIEGESDDLPDAVVG